MEQLIFQKNSREKLSKKEIAELFVEYNKTKDIKIKEKIIGANIGLIPMTITQYFASAPANAFDDMVSEGLKGLSRAVELYKPEENIAFSSYAVKSIWGTIIRYLKRVGKYEDVISLDQPVQNEVEDVATPLIELLPGETEFEEKLVVKLDSEQKMKFIYRFLSQLEDRERDIVIRYWGLNGKKETVRAIAEDYGLAFSRVHQIVQKQMKRMRNFLLKKGNLSAEEKTKLRNVICGEDSKEETSLD